MKNVIIYYSQTGNTEALANRINDEVAADLKTFGEITVDEALSYDNILLGCPALGDEELDDDVLEFSNELKDLITNQNIYLFGSYGWGDGQWLRSWKEMFSSCKNTLAVNEGIENLNQDEFDDFVKDLH